MIQYILSLREPQFKIPLLLTERTIMMSILHLPSINLLLYSSVQGTGSNGSTTVKSSLIP